MLVRTVPHRLRACLNQLEVLVEFGHSLLVHQGLQSATDRFGFAGLHERHYLLMV